MEHVGKFQLKMKYALDSYSTEVNTCMLYHYHKDEDSYRGIYCVYNTILSILPYGHLIHLMIHIVLCVNFCRTPKNPDKYLSKRIVVFKGRYCTVRKDNTDPKETKG